MGAAFDTPENECNRKTTSSTFLTLFQSNPEFLRRFLIVNKTWIHWFRNTGLQTANLLRRRQRLLDRPERRCPPSSRICKVWSTSITSRSIKQSQDDTMLSFWCRFDVELKKRQPRFAKKKCYSTTITRRFTPPLLLWPNWANCATNWCLIRVFFLFPNLKKTLAGNKFGSNENVFFERVKKVGALLGQMYRAWVKLCIKLYYVLSNYTVKIKTTTAQQIAHI